MEEWVRQLPGTVTNIPSAYPKRNISAYGSPIELVLRGPAQPWWCFRRPRPLLVQAAGSTRSPTPSTARSAALLTRARY